MVGLRDVEARAPGCDRRQQHFAARGGLEVAERLHPHWCLHVAVKDTHTASSDQGDPSPCILRGVYSFDSKTEQAGGQQCLPYLHVAVKACHANVPAPRCV